MLWNVPFGIKGLTFVIRKIMHFLFFLPWHRFRNSNSRIVPASLWWDYNYILGQLLLPKTTLDSIICDFGIVQFLNTSISWTGDREGIAIFIRVLMPMASSSHSKREAPGLPNHQIISCNWSIPSIHTPNNLRCSLLFTNEKTEQSSPISQKYEESWFSYSPLNLLFTMIPPTLDHRPKQITRDNQKFKRGIV